MARRVFVVPDHIAATAAPAQWTSQRQQWTDDKRFPQQCPSLLCPIFIEKFNIYMQTFIYTVFQQTMKGEEGVVI